MNLDNKFAQCCGCPAQMEDGRIFTNYMNNTRLNEYIKDANDITNNHEYRLFLQKNAEKMMNYEKSFLDKNKRCQYRYRYWMPNIPRPVENNY